MNSVVRWLAKFLRQIATLDTRVLVSKPIPSVAKSSTRKRREAAVFNARNHRNANEIKAKEAAQRVDEQRTQHFAQYDTYVDAMRTVNLNRDRDAQPPGNAELLGYSNLLDSLSVNLLSKRDQMSCLRLQYRVAEALNDGRRMAKALGSASAVAEVPSIVMPYSKLNSFLPPETEIERDLTWVYHAHAELLLRGGKNSQAKTMLDRGAEVLRSFGFETDVDGWYDVLGILDREKEAEAERQQVIEFIRQHPGLLQADFLKNHDLATSEMLYWMAQRGEIIRIKSGRTYALSVPVEPPA